MKNKIIIINPEDDENNLVDGDLTCIGEMNGENNHCDLLIDYGLKVYGKKSIFEILSQGNFLTDVPVFFLCEGNNNVVILNVSSPRIGKIALLYMPSEMSERQWKTLKKIDLKDFEIEMNYNLRVDEGIVDSDRKIIKGDTINHYHSKVKKKA